METGQLQMRFLTMDLLLVQRDSKIVVMAEGTNTMFWKVKLLIHPIPAKRISILNMPLLKFCNNDYLKFWHQTIVEISKLGQYVNFCNIMTNFSRSNFLPSFGDWREASITSLMTILRTKFQIQI